MNDDNEHSAPSQFEWEKQDAEDPWLAEDDLVMSSAMDRQTVNARKVSLLRPMKVKFSA